MVYCGRKSFFCILTEWFEKHFSDKSVLLQHVEKQHYDQESKQTIPDISTKILGDDFKMDNNESRGANLTIKTLTPDGLGQDEDWEGNNAAFTCPLCKKVFIVNCTRMHMSPQKEKGYRKCPSCLKSVGRVTGGKKSGGTASIEWYRMPN